MLSDFELIARLVIAALLGSVIGFERERLFWAAGLRTHMLVCVGSALIMLVSAYGFAGVLGNEHVVLDPSRVAAQVVSGIGFLGAGSILLRGEVVRGLTTAASLWTVAGIGLAVGGGLYTAGIAATLIILAILAGLKPLEERYRASWQSASVVLQADRGTVSMHRVHEALGPRANKVRQFVVEQSEDDPELDEVRVVLSRVSKAQAQEIMNALTGLDGVRSGRSGRPGAQ
ncbi:MgtC/SapB family protein [Chitinasiproducens palmae]|uniref:Protein MgtC n=1 Tax=Chitinasiproducens palmae TaxID=1770053 RepID=A0A1H2PTP3_9BURK|nr:MgtC/SapB family protein [Chitinasiproducens palmae]SDV49652.1 putative Mg2+ transporter-C (MgtC) family protein [Chitinasiproducens palmae]